MAEMEAMPEQPADRVRVVLDRVLAELELEGEVRISEGEEEINAEITGDGDFGLLIGRRGQTIDALQLLCYQAAYRGIRERKRVRLDVGGYRERRREAIERRADRAADQALKLSRPVELEPMSAQERRLVHERLKERAGIETYSEGDDPHRCVVVAPLVTD
jgi:spoIIIJ-associated protein